MSPSDSAKPRQRQFKPETRTGCRTCKIRRVKCGEERPSCMRCTSTGRVCDGYVETIRIAKTTTDVPGEVVLRWEQPSSQPPNATSAEQEALYSVRESLLDCSYSTSDTDVWQRLVLPLSTSEPAVRHALVALSSFTRPGGTHNALALQSYGRSIKMLQSKISEGTQPRHFILVTCLLFVAIEFLQHGWEQAHFQLNGGISIIKEMWESAARSRRASASKDNFEPLEHLFERLDNQMSLFTSTRVQLNRALDNARMAALPAEIRLRSLADAGRLHSLHVAAMRELGFEIESQRFTPTGVAATSYAELEIQLGRQLVSLDRWGAAMGELIPRLLEPKDRRAAKLLMMSHLCCKLMVSNALSDGREEYHDWYMPEFEQILSLGTECLSSMTEQSCLQQRRFSLDTGIVAPTYFTALKCRDPALRRQAVSMLKSYYGQEGAWDSQTMAMLAEKVISVEEDGLDDPQSAADVQERNRLWQAWFDLETGSDRLYCMRRAWEENGEWLKYEIYVGERLEVHEMQRLGTLCMRG